eukprot:scaffold380517_cov66-Cyclotella_meneghiniana.AAC.1
MSTDDKKPSKKELKKLAKKAEKAAVKNGTAAPTPPSANANGSSPSSTTNNPPSYQLANAAINDTCTLKACLSSILHNVPLVPSSSSAPSFVHGPSLHYGDVMVFGGNGIAKALAMANSNNNKAAVVTSAMDDWMEYERCTLRPALSSNNDKKIKDAVQILVEALEKHGGTSVVGDVPLTVADAVITLSLIEHEGLWMKNVNADTMEILTSYVNITKSSSQYASAQRLVRTLLPPSLDETDPSLLRAASFVFQTAIRQICPNATSLDVETKAFKCKDMKYGDYQCNAAMPLFQKLKATGSLPI